MILHFLNLIFRHWMVLFCALTTLNAQPVRANDGALFWYVLSQTDRQLIFDCEVDIWSETLSNGDIKVWIYLKTRRKGAVILAVEQVGKEIAETDLSYPLELHGQTQTIGLGWARRLDLVLRIGYNGVPLSFEVRQSSVYAGVVDDKSIVCAGHPSARNRRERVD